MDKLNNRGKLIVSIVVAVVAIVLIAYYGAGTPSSAPSGENATSTSSATNPSTGATGTSNTQSTGGSAGGSGSASGGTKTPASIITFVTPVPGETWTIAKQNPIQWSRAGGVSGEISLLDASTKALVGVILPQTGPNQTSYAWNTRDIFLSRTNPLKKNVEPGRYVVRISWDGNNLSPITSEPITISL